jgi:hypothetical protein
MRRLSGRRSAVLVTNGTGATACAPARVMDDNSVAATAAVLAGEVGRRRRQPVRRAGRRICGCFGTTGCPGAWGRRDVVADG